MTFTLPDRLALKFAQLRELNDSVRASLPTINEKRNANDIRHQVVFISLVRVIKYFDAYLLLAENGYGEPAASLLRSIYEASLWMRWSVISDGNAQRYFDASKGEALRWGDKLFNRGLAQLANAPDQEEAKRLVKSSLKSFRLPTWEELAKDTGLADLHAVIYPMLSAMSHGSMLFLGERILGDKSVSPEPDEMNIELFIPIANNVLLDCSRVCHDWIVNGRLRPVSDIRKLMTRSS